MATIQAHLSITQPSFSSRPVRNPAIWPSWTASNQHTLTTDLTFAGYTTTWSVDGLTLRAVSLPSPEKPTATVLAHFPPLDASSATLSSDSSLPYSLSWKQNSSASLCVASSQHVLVSTPGADFYECPIPDARFSAVSISNLFVPSGGLIIEVSHFSNRYPQYYFMSHPLHEMTQLPLPASHRVIYVSCDIPVIVSRTKTELSVWTFSQTEDEPDTQVSNAKSADPIAALIASASPPEEPTCLLEVQPRRRILMLTQVFVSALGEFEDASVFLAHDLHGLLVLCIVTLGSLTGLSLKLNDTDLSVVQADPAFRVRDAASAVPVLSIRRPHSCTDVLIRHSNGTMSLFMGRNRLCTVEPKPVTSTVGLVLSDGVGDEFTLRDQVGHCTRYSFHQSCFRSPLVNACVSALSFTFESCDSLRRVMAIYHDMLNAMKHSGFESKHGLRREWEMFESVILRHVDGNIVSDQDSDVMNVDNETASQGSVDDWKYLLGSEFHMSKGWSRSYGPLPHARRHRLLVRENQKVADSDTVTQIMRALHLLYENFKFDKLANDMLSNLSRLNVRLAKAIGALSFVDYYTRDFPELVNFARVPESSSVREHVAVPSLLEALQGIMRRESQESSEYPELSVSRALSTPQHLRIVASWRAKSPFELSRQLLCYYEHLFAVRRLPLDQKKVSESLCLTMVMDGFRRTDLDLLPFGVALPLQDALWICRQQPKDSWPSKMYALIGREDLLRASTPKCGDAELLAQTDFSKLDENRALLQVRAKGALSSVSNHDTSPEMQKITLSQSKSNESEAGDGCDMDGDIYGLRFSSDRRLEEVRRILRSTDFTIMTPIHIPKEETTAEFDIVAEQRFKLGVLVRKRLAAPVGRGAFTLRTFVPSDPTQSLPVPPICLSGKLYAQKGAKVTVSHLDPKRLQWSDFHNGVAAGLRIVAAEEENDCAAGHILTRSWIVKHKPTDTSGDATHAGMLLAFGLGGYLPALRKTDYYQYLIPRHELTSIGLMLGLAAGNIGSMHEKLTKMMCLHIKYFNRPGFAVPDFNVTINVQTAAILGLGLLHCGSPEQMILEGLFAELGRSPRPGDPVDDREGLALAAGISIGLLCLGNGSSAFAAADRRYIERLLLYANGGPIEKLPLSEAKDGSEPSKGDVLPGQGHPRAGPSMADSETSRIRESNFVNTDVVSPAALHALALIYMKTNNRLMASRIEMPTTLYALDRTRPHHVFLRMLTKSLIMWDEMRPSEEWLLKCIPRLLHASDSDGNSNPLNVLGKVNVADVYKDTEVDVRGVLQARAFAIAGACTAIALKYAGTNEPSAIGILQKACLSFKDALKQKGTYFESLEWILMTCLCSLSLAIAIIGAGSGDLGIFRLLRMLRKINASGNSERYGFHLAMHMAIGFLFLGGGCLTFGSSNTAIAGLLCAVYPFFPRATDDNKYHLQALRHLYVLAVEPRCIEPRDVDTGKPCSLDIEVRLKNDSKLALKAPCIVPNADRISEVAIVSERYLPSVFTINPSRRDKGWYSGTRNQVVFVKRRTGHLPYTEDPRGCKGILARSSTYSYCEGNGRKGYNFVKDEKLVKAFSVNPDVLSFVKYLCNEQSHSSKHSIRLFQPSMCADLLLECLSHDKPEALKLYMDAARVLKAMERRQIRPSDLGGLVLADGYVQTRDSDSSSMLKSSHIAAVVWRAHQLVDTVSTKSGLLNYVSSGGRLWPKVADDSIPGCHIVYDLANALRLNRIPQVIHMSRLSAVLRDLGSLDESDGKWLAFSNVDFSVHSETPIEAIIHALERETMPDNGAKRSRK
ncbi:Anaphase-promoting complex subunit 1 [Gracilaria domingensis]|nr:Anaphase-promoting complex subunit 1 [Gracilaria domingensis]